MISLKALSLEVEGSLPIQWNRNRQKAVPHGPKWQGNLHSKSNTEDMCGTRAHHAYIPFGAIVQLQRKWKVTFGRRENKYRESEIEWKDESFGKFGNQKFYQNF